MRAFNEAEQCAIGMVYGANDREPLPISSLGREARLRRESDREDATNPVCSPEAAEDARQALCAQTAQRLTAEEIARMSVWLDFRNPEQIADWWHVAFEPERIVATLEVLTVEREGARTREDAVYARAYRKGFYDGSGGTTALPSEVDAAHERWAKRGRKTHLEEEH